MTTGSWQERDECRTGSEIFRDDELSRLESRYIDEKHARNIEVNMHYLTGEKCKSCDSPMFWSDQGKPDYCSFCKRIKKEV